ncbi:MAG: transcription antitermination factor NusB, partial [Armatimonadota bacterium]
MSPRRLARELALKLLFQVDVGHIPLAEVLAHYREDNPDLPEAALDYAEQLVRGVARHIGEIDKILENLAEDWSLERLASVDRNILRIATYELLYETTVPVSAAINEAVELAKTYSTAESGRFVNG